MVKQRHKYGAVSVIRKGIKFPSKLEAKLAAHLDLLTKAGEVIFYLRQPMFDLPGGTKYTADFQVFWTNGEISFMDAKGVETKEFIRSKKQVEGIYPVTIEVWKGKK
jgi:hypothetical protein